MNRTSNPSAGKPRISLAATPSSSENPCSRATSYANRSSSTLEPNHDAQRPPTPCHPPPHRPGPPGDERHEPHRPQGREGGAAKQAGSTPATPSDATAPEEGRAHPPQRRIDTRA